MCYFVDRDVTVTGTYTPTDTKGTKVIYDLDLTRGWNLVYYREDMEGDMLLDGYYTTLPASAGDMSWIGHTW